MKREKFNKKRYSTLFLGLLCVILSCTRQQAIPVQAKVTVNTAAMVKTYNPMIFGGFLEHFGDQIYGGVFEPNSPLADKDGFRKDVVAALKELNTTAVRWPGGCYVSGYHWENGVGRNRPLTDDMVWGVQETNTFGTDEFIKLSRLVGWQPYICNNAGNGTIEEMCNWIEYCNGNTGEYAQMRKDNGYPNPMNVNIWSIGNENYLKQEIGYKPIEEWAPFVTNAAKAMKKVDPTVQISAATSNTREWILPLLKVAGPYLTYISIHQYWFPFWQKHEMPDYMAGIMKSEGPDKMISDVVDILEESGYRGKIKIAFDEWNLRGWHHAKFPRKTVQNYEDPEVIEAIKSREKNNIASQYNMSDALFSASFLNACLRHSDDVSMANIAPSVNTRGPLYVHPKGIVKRTHFHALAMYANKLQPNIVPLEIAAEQLIHEEDSIDVVDAIATLDEKGTTWSIALINRHPSDAINCTVNMGNQPLKGKFSATMLTADSPEAFNSIENPDRVAPKEVELKFDKGIVELPPHSLTIVHIE
ncbi:MAG: hypothetical protein MK226_19965 [Saprospiraceae bacterium]|nr:hypothetical protein [Saprospiraceae bacterium]